jgi:FkbM family methyltransferase
VTLPPALAWRVARLRRQSGAFDALCRLYDARPHVIEQSGVKLQFGYHLAAKVRQALLDGEYEEKELRLLRTTLTRGDKVMELGTGLGFLASFCAKQIGAERVVTYEGNPQMERHIRRNFALNGVAPTLIMSLVGREAEERAFHLNREAWCSSTWKRPGTVSTITVPVRPFNEEVRSVKPSLLIIDIEGGEVELVPHMDLTGIRGIVIELHEQVTGPEGLQTVRQSLLARGFRLEEIGDPEHCLFLR